MMHRRSMRLPMLVAAGLASIAVGSCAKSSTEPAPACPADPSQMVLVSGEMQRAFPGAAFADPLVVFVGDSAGRPFPYATVVFTVTAGSGFFTPDSSISDFGGLVDVRYTLSRSSRPDTQQVRAAVRTHCGRVAPSVTFHEIVVSPTRPAGFVAASRLLGSRPFGIAVNGGGLLLVTQLDAANVTTGRTDSLTLGGSIGVGSTPTAVAFNPAGTTAYVANQFNDNIGIVDVASRTQVATVRVTGDAFSVIVSPSGATAYATTNAGWLYAIGTDSRAVTDSVQVGDAPSAMAFGSGDTLLYVSLRNNGTVSEVRLGTPMTVARAFTVGGVPQGVVTSPNRAKLWVANEAGWVSAINLATGGIASTPLPAGGFGMALTTDSTQLYITLPSSGRVAVVDAASLSLVQTIATGGIPRRIAFSPNGLTAVVANEAGSVDFIR